MAGWKPKEQGDGERGRGIGFARYKNLGCYVAVIVRSRGGGDRARRARVVRRSTWAR